MKQDQAPCKHFSSWDEDVAGDGGSRMPMTDCDYEGETLEECDETCPGYDPMPSGKCEKHPGVLFYNGVCHKCENEWFDKIDEERKQVEEYWRAHPEPTPTDEELDAMIKADPTGR